MNSTERQVLERLQIRWPGREQQLATLVSLFGLDANEAVPCTFVYGASSTGKTCVIRDTLRELQRQVAYVSATESTQPRQLLQSILRQLQVTKRKCSELLAGRCGSSDQTSDLLVQLSDLAARQSSWAAIIVDHADRIADQTTMAVLTRLFELTGAKLAVVFISQLAWGSNAFEHDLLHTTRPATVHFPAYSLPELTKIMALSAPAGEEAACYIRFLQQAMRSLSVRVWQQAGIGICERWQIPQEATASSQPSGALDFELPFMSKFLLLAAYIAARNRATLDRRLFDPKAKAYRRKGALAQDRQVETAREARLQGPGLFALERLLYVFWGLLRCSCDDTDDEPFSPTDELSAGIFTQISSLVSLQLLTQVNSDADLEVKYRCNVSDVLAHKIASNVSIQLQHYVLYV
ncbi:hypothetical protein WJX84_012066 [Apatococcus fuscideae]|uniref:Origin recognition complex subunit 5 n=1 Tax=Apatococcus fuscideae TaxID=2026836 RepID=A0AAW1SL26_9CHLO